MLIARIENATRVIGKSQGYLGLPLAALNAGAAVHVRILGTVHPPIMLDVGPVPGEAS